MAQTEDRRPIKVGPEAPGLPALVLALFLVLSCAMIVLAGGGRGEYQFRWVLIASDLFLGVVVLTQVPQLRTLWSERNRHRCALAAVAVAVSLLPSLAVHPSSRGGVALFRWIGVAMIALAIGRLAGSDRSLVLATFGGVSVLQVVVALAERAGDDPVGFIPASFMSLGAPQSYAIGGRYASKGLTIHPYMLAAWCVLGGAVLLAALIRAPRPPVSLAVAALVPFVGVGLTMSRAGALGVVLVLASFGLAALRQPRLRVVFLGALAAAAIGVALDLSGWLNRAESTKAAGSSLAGVTSGRTEMLGQAWGLLRSDPVLGVGPGRYVMAVVERPELVKLSTERPPRPVHVVPYLVLVEGGLVVLPALILMGWAVVTQTRRAGIPGVLVGVALVPFMLLDHLNWSYPQGLLLTGVWLGALDQLSRGGPAETAA